MSFHDRNLLVIEGPDGSGKTTLRRALTERLTKDKVDHVQIREPGGTILGEALRNIILSKYDETVHPETDLLMHMAYRVQNIRELIFPALQAGKWVVLDRFFYSTWCLQVQGSINTHPHLAKMMMELMPYVTGGFIPEPVVFLLDTPKEIRQARLALRADLDRHEDIDEARSIRIDAAYDQMKSGPSTYTLDGSKSIDELVEEILLVMKAHQERLVEQAEKERAQHEKLQEDLQNIESGKSIGSTETESVPTPVHSESESVDEFDLETTLEKYAEENIIDGLFDATPREELEATKEKYRVIAKGIAREVYAQVKDPTIFHESRVGQLNRHIHSMIAYGEQLIRACDRLNLKL